MDHDKIWIYLGTYTHAAGRGIYRCDFDLATGELAYGGFESDCKSDDASRAGLAAETNQPSFLALHPKRPLLYCVNEVSDYEQGESGIVSAYEIGQETGRLKLLNRRASLGPKPCHLAADPTGRCLLVANYAAGSVACFPIRPDGSLGESSSFFMHHGSSVHPTRQTCPHAHGVTVDPAGRFVFVPDLGMDKVVVYRLDAENCRLKPNAPTSVELPPGAGPRHIVFSQDARFAYVVNELLSTISVFRYDCRRGILSAEGETTTLPGGYGGDNLASEIALHPADERFLYVSNRGHDSIAIFEIAGGGMPILRGHQPTYGQSPRGFCITPDGKYLLAANQNSGNVTVSRIDADTGDLTYASSSLKVPSPVCILAMLPSKTASWYEIGGQGVSWQRQRI